MSEQPIERTKHDASWFTDLPDREKKRILALADMVGLDMHPTEYSSATDYLLDIYRVM